MKEMNTEKGQEKAYEKHAWMYPVTFLLFQANNLSIGQPMDMDAPILLPALVLALLLPYRKFFPARAVS